MSPMEILQIVLRSVAVAGVATGLILLPGVALGFLLARRDFPGKRLVQALTLVPMVVPPVAVGLLLVLLLGQNGPLGGLGLLFTWRAAALASACIAFPLLVRAAEQAFHEVPRPLEAVARTLGAGPLRTFLSVTLPLAWRGIVYGAAVAFARALGEFGATALVAGNIPGRTQTLALGIFSAVENADDATALTLAGISAALALAVTWGGEVLVGRRRQ